MGHDDQRQSLGLAARRKGQDALQRQAVGGLVGEHAGGPDIVG